MVPASFFERKNRKCDFLQAKLSAATNRQMHEASRTFDIPRLYSAWGKEELSTMNDNLQAVNGVFDEIKAKFCLPCCSGARIFPDASS
jgi:hypothetical protein